MARENDLRIILIIVSPIPVVLKNGYELQRANSQSRPLHGCKSCSSYHLRVKNAEGERLWMSNLDTCRYNFK